MSSMCWSKEGIEFTETVCQARPMSWQLTSRLLIIIVIIVIDNNGNNNNYNITGLISFYSKISTVSEYHQCNSICNSTTVTDSIKVEFDILCFTYLIKRQCNPIGYITETKISRWINVNNNIISQSVIIFVLCFPPLSHWQLRSISCIVLIFKTHLLNSMYCWLCILLFFVLTW